MGETEPRLQIAPVLERLVLPRARAAMETWLEQLLSCVDLQWLVPAHYNAPVRFSSQVAGQYLEAMRSRPWAPSEKNWTFLADLDHQLLKRGVVPKHPLPSSS